MSGNGGWDWAAQKADTEASFADIAAQAPVGEGEPITLDLQFSAGQGADRAGFIAAMREAGFSGSAYATEGGEETIEATVPGVPFTAAAIWEVEERATRIALAHGYRPEGWGFEDPRGASGDGEDDIDGPEDGD